MKKNETYFQTKFLEFYKKHDFFKGSIFTREVPQFYSFDETLRKKSSETPYSIIDFIELDKYGKFHLWEAKLINSDELKKGKVLGQLLFYDFLFKSYPEKELKDVLIKNGFDENTILNMTYDDFTFETWNILVCGGEGWELCAGINPIIWNYPTLPEEYFKDIVPNVNIFHFYEVKGGYDLKNIWELNIDTPQKLHTEAFAKYLSLDYVPKNEELDSLYLEFFNLQEGLSPKDFEILIDFNNESNQQVFLEMNNIDMNYINMLNNKFQSSLSRLHLDCNEEQESNNLFNTFIGRDWFV